MGLIKEPLDVDFVVDPRPFTKAEEKAISDFIKADKEKHLAKTKRANKRKPKRSEKISCKRALLATSHIIRCLGSSSLRKSSQIF